MTLTGALVDVNGHGLAALIVILLAVVVVVAVGARLLRPPHFRIARLGVFVERERFPTPEERELQRILHEHGQGEEGNGEAETGELRWPGD